MATRTFDQEFTRPMPVRFPESGPVSAIASTIGDAFAALGPWGRRHTAAGVGALVALSLGAAAGAVLRLPADLNAAPTAQSQALVQTELPAETAVRTYALENPPTYAPTKHTLVGVGDAAPAAAPADDQSFGDGDQRPAAPPTPASLTPSTHPDPSDAG